MTSGYYSSDYTTDYSAGFKNKLNHNNHVEEISDLAKIELKSDNPYDLFKEWHKEACAFSTGLPHALCLSTVSK